MIGISLRWRLVLIACLAVVALAMTGNMVFQLRAQRDANREAAAHDQGDALVLDLLRKVRDGERAASGSLVDPSPEAREVLRGFAAAIVAAGRGLSAGYCTSDGEVVVSESGPPRVLQPGPDTGHRTLDIAPERVFRPASKGALLPADHNAVVVACRASNERETQHLRVSLPGDRLMIAVRRADPRLAAWAIVRLPPTRDKESDPWRMGFIATGVLTVLLVFLAGDAVFALRRGAGDLEIALHRLQEDLRADVPRPRLAELAHIAHGLRIMASNLADARERERALEKRSEHEKRLAGLGRVVAGVAHEVRNPLTGIKLMLDGMARRRIDERSARDVATCLEEIARLDRVVTSLLLVSRKEPVEKAAVDLAALVDERLASAEARAQERGVRLARGGDAIGWIHRDMFTRVLDNLVRNAIEASPEGAEVTVTLERAAGETRVAVLDRGDGVPAGRAAELFEPFFSLKAEGTGLGLFLSRSVVEAHGGRLVYSRGDGVTRFLVHLPLDAPDAESAASSRR